MFLKALEVQGFKSFPDKTVLQFGSDITAIIGPNGSGKSNISDAISWVMGEQSSKALRGAKMEDVIFGGTQKRAPVGFAEATLILDNRDGSLRMETPEVTITRRYFRSGESEYYINRESARLRDIHELLMDTGLGREGYSNIGQGRIDEILSVKSTERREIFEEAAGISKCRYRKVETERRLAATEENLLRIGDKISELELQVEPLREQAEKAKKYLVLREELKGFEVTVWLDTLTKLSATAKKAEEDYASAAFVLEQAHSDLNNLYAAGEQLSLELNRQTLLLDEKHEAISLSEQERQKAEADLSVLQAGVQNRKENIARVKEEISEQESRSGGIHEQIRQQEARIAVIAEELASVDAALREAMEQSSALAATSDQTTGKLLQLRANQALLTTESANRAAEIAALRASLEEVTARKQTLQADHDAAQARCEEIENQAAECRKSLRLAQENVTAANNTIDGYRLRLQTQTQKRDAMQKEVDARTVELDTASAKLRMLREMERDYEGFSKAVKSVMQEAGKGVLRGVHGPVSSLLHTDDEYTTAIETALG
ncbi:MAG: AAA family ATPase, partial [Oscillospiraceae bacterium]|nr:AAA family ATPase [Oscillospiraceae bacterium]